MSKVKIIGFRCERCGHTWVPQNIDKPPRVCPKCRSPYWDRPRTRSPAKNPGGK